MQCISLKELLFFISIWHISEEMKDILEEIQTSDENPSDLNAFFEDVMKFKKAFKMIRRAAAESEEDGLMSKGRLDKDIDEYVYDEENFVANTKKVQDEKLAPKNNKNSPLQKPNRPLNDIYPHIYKGHPDQEYVDKYLENLNFDKGPRYRRQLVEDVEVEPKSTKGYVAVMGDKATMVNSNNEAKLMENDAHETLMTIFSQLGKSTHPVLEESTPNIKSQLSTTKTPNSQNTFEVPVSIILTTIRPLDSESTTIADANSLDVQKEKSKRELKIDIIKDGKVVKEYSNENENVPCVSPKQTSISLNIVQPAVPSVIDSGKDLNINDHNNLKEALGDPGHFQKVESRKTPLSASEIERTHGNPYVQNIPKFVGNIMDEIQSNYRSNVPKKTRPYYYYRPYMEPIYSEDPRRMYYANNFQNMIYNTPYYQQSVQQDFENEEGEDKRDTSMEQPQEGMNSFRSRSLKFFNDTNEDLDRFERNVQEILGMDNEDDYTEDLAFKTDSPKTIKYAEEDDEISPSRTFVKLKTVESETTSSNSADVHYISSTPAEILTTTPTLSYDNSTMAATATQNIFVTKNRRKRRNRRYRKIKGQKLLSRLRKRCKPCQATEREFKKYRLADVDINPPRFKASRCYNFNKRYSTTDENQYNNLKRRTEGSSFVDQNSAKGPGYQKKFYKDRYHYASNAWCNNMDFHSIPYQTRDFYSKFYGDIKRRRNLENCNCSCCRKLMARGNIENEDIIQKRDVIDDVNDEGANDSTEIKEKRTESDYGEEPDLSEGQNFKKHTKFKKHNKVMAPSRNFEDNYEYEEVPNEKKNSFLGFGKNCNHKKKCRKKKYKLKKADHHSCQVSFRDRLARLKNKLFSSQPDETEKALREEIPYSDQYDEYRRSERQSEPTHLKEQDYGFIGSSKRLEVGADSDNKRQCCYPCCNPSDPCTPLFSPCQHPCNPCSGSHETCPCDPSQPTYDSCPCQPCCPVHTCSSSSSEPCSDCCLPCPPIPCSWDPSMCPIPEPCPPASPHPYQPCSCPIQCSSSSNVFSGVGDTDKIESHIKERCPSACSDIYSVYEPCTCPTPCPYPYPPSSTFPCSPPISSPCTNFEERKNDESNEDYYSEHQNEQNIISGRSSESNSDSMNLKVPIEHDIQDNDRHSHSMKRRSYYIQNIPDYYKPFFPCCNAGVFPHPHELYPYRGYWPYMPFTNRKNNEFHKTQVRDADTDDQPAADTLRDQRTSCTSRNCDPFSYPCPCPCPMPSSSCPYPCPCPCEPSPCPNPCEPCPYPYPCNPCQCCGPLVYSSIRKRHVKFNCPEIEGRYPPFCCDTVFRPCPCQPTCPCPFQYPCPCPVPCPYTYSPYTGESADELKNSKLHDIRERCSSPSEDSCTSFYPDPTCYPYSIPQFPFSCPCPMPCRPQSSSPCPYPCSCPSLCGKYENAESVEEKNIHSRNAEINNPTDSNESGQNEDSEAVKYGFSNCPPCSNSIYIGQSPSPDPSGSLPPPPCPSPCPPCPSPCPPCPPPGPSNPSSNIPSPQPCPPCPPTGPPCTPTGPSSPPTCSPCPSPMQPSNQSFSDPCEPQNPDYDDNDNTDIYERNERSKFTMSDSKEKISHSSESESDYPKREDKHSDIRRLSYSCSPIPLSNPRDESSSCSCSFPCTTCSSTSSPCLLHCTLCPYPLPCSVSPNYEDAEDHNIREKRSDVIPSNLKNSKIIKELNEEETLTENKAREKKENCPQLKYQTQPNLQSKDESRHSKMQDAEDVNQQKSSLPGYIYIEPRCCPCPNPEVSCACPDVVCPCQCLHPLHHQLGERCVLGFLHIPSPCSLHIPNPFKSCGTCLTCQPCSTCCSTVPNTSGTSRDTCGHLVSCIPCSPVGIPSSCAFLKKRFSSFTCPCSVFFSEPCRIPEMNYPTPELDPLPSSSHNPTFPVPCSATCHIPGECSFPGKRSDGYVPWESYTVYFSPFIDPSESIQNDLNDPSDSINMNRDSLKYESPSENEESKSNHDTKHSTEKETTRVKRHWLCPKPSKNCPKPKLSRNTFNCFTPPYCQESVNFNDPFFYYKPICQSLCSARPFCNCLDGYDNENPASDAFESPYSNPCSDPGLHDSQYSYPPWYCNCDNIGSYRTGCNDGIKRQSVQRRSNSLEPGVILPSTASASDLIADPGLDNGDKEKRKCPNNCESHPLYTAHPPPLPLPCDDTTNDMLAQRVRQVNEYLKNQYLNGRYTINNQNVPMNRRQLPSMKSPARCSRMESLDRLVRRIHGVPKKPTNRRLPTQNEDLRYLENFLDDKNFIGSRGTHNICKRKNVEMNEENTCQGGKINRHCIGRAIPTSEGKSKTDLNPEDFMLLQKKSNSEYQDMHFAKEIVEAVMNKVNKNANLKIKIGNALNKKRIYETENNQRNYAKVSSFEERAEYEEAKNLLRSVSCVMNKLVKKQIEEKLCEKLPGHLKNFLKRIVRPPKHRINQRHDDKYHEDTFLFRASCPTSKLGSNTRNKLEVNMVNLLDRYDQLDEDSKKRAAPLKSYILNHLEMLKKIDDETYHTETPDVSPDGYAESNESPHARINSEESKLDNPLNSRNSFNNLDIMEKDLENLDLNKKGSSFEQPPFGLNSFTPVKITDEDNSIDNKLKKRNTDKLTEKNTHKRETDDDLTSDKYKKLIKAAEEVRVKRKNDEKIAEAFGNKKVDENDPDAKEQDDQIAFETPPVYRT